MVTSQVVSKQRVADHGEVLTNEREVKAMLDLVWQETQRIESRFLEPACGTGNFLTEVLERKLKVIRDKYRKSQLEYERNAVLAVSSIYGIELLGDNVQQCRKRLLEIFEQHYFDLYKDKTEAKCLESVWYILNCNIIQGDALTLKTVEENPQPIVFPEWSLVNGNLLKRRDFTFEDLLKLGELKELPLFSDQGKNVYIPQPIKDYPLTNFLDIAHACE